MPKGKFIKNKEDFVCNHCGAKVFGSGYTNHCPNCLWSKHVDINPGDRASNCEGMMKPVSIEGSTNKYTILHRCDVCGYEKRNKAAENDNIDAILSVIAEKINEQSPR